MDEVLRDSQVLHNACIVDAPHDDISGGTVRYARPAAVFGAAGELPQLPAQAAPAIGAHSVALLRENGIDDAEVRALQEGGVVFQRPTSKL